MDKNDRGGDKVKEQLEGLLRDIQVQLNAERQKGAEGNQTLIAQLETEESGLQSQLDELLRKERVEKQEEHTGGLKENLYSIFDALLPKDEFSKLIGLSEYEEKQQDFNQLIEIAVTDSNTALFEHFGKLLEEKDAKFQELTTTAIGLKAEVQEARQKAELAAEEADESDRKYTELSGEYRDLEASYQIAVGQLEEKNHTIEGLKIVEEAKNAEIDELRNQLNRAPAPRAGFTDVTPAPSARFEEIKAQAAEKSMTNLERVLAGLAPVRGVVTRFGEDHYEQLHVPPIHGGSNDGVSFQVEGNETTAAESGDSGISAANPAEVEEAEERSFPNAESAVDGLADSAPDENGELVTRQEFEALQRRVDRLEGTRKEAVA